MSPIAEQLGNSLPIGLRIIGTSGIRAATVAGSVGHYDLPPMLSYGCLGGEVPYRSVRSMSQDAPRRSTRVRRYGELAHRRIAEIAVVLVAGSAVHAQTEASLIAQETR
jgi:hypothetical protein